MLPEKEIILEHRCEPVTKKLMIGHKWSKKLATQWFVDFMCWLYSAQKWAELHDKKFAMDTGHYLDDVWHCYILHTKEYMLMCNQLFHKDYIHHAPSDPFKKSK